MVEAHIDENSEMRVSVGKCGSGGTGSHCPTVGSLIVIAQGEVRTLAETKRPPSATLEDSPRQLGQC